MEKEYKTYKKKGGILSFEEFKKQIEPANANSIDPKIAAVIFGWGFPLNKEYKKYVKNGGKSSFEEFEKNVETLTRFAGMKKKEVEFILLLIKGNISADEYRMIRRALQ